MRMRLKILVLMAAILMTGIVGGCDSKDQAEVEESFEKVLDMYPTKDLTAFYDMEGYRDSNFDEEDKGTWILQSSMSVAEDKDAPLISKGMVLKINRNTRTAEGYYYKREYNFSDRKGIDYPVIYNESGFHVKDESTDPDIKKEIEDFQFFVQYGVFENLDQYENIKKMYNPEVPMYELEYQLTNNDTNVQKLRERYDISTSETPTLRLNGRGNLDGSSVGYKRLEFDFDKEVDVFFSDMIDYQPTMEEDSSEL